MFQLDTPVAFGEGLSDFEVDNLFPDKNILCFNLFSRLKLNKPFIFIKTDWVEPFFHEIRKLDFEVVLIIGNSDYCVGHSYHPIGSELPSLVPSNVTHIFTQNLLQSGAALSEGRCKWHCLPVGIENYLPCSAQNSGPIVSTGVQKYFYLRQLSVISRKIKPSELIYANFKIREHCQSAPHRNRVSKICRASSHIVTEESNLSIPNFFSRVLDHRAVVCPQGNGPGDNHRIYEVLYLGRIPITFNPVMFENIHRHYPVVLLENEEQLLDKSFMENEITRAERITNYSEKLTLSYWSNFIIGEIGQKGIT